MSEGARRATDRGMWRVVAARDFWVRLRDQGFVISTMITLSVLSVFILIRAYTGGPDSFQLGYVGDRLVADRVAALADRSGIEVSVVGFDDPGRADDALRDGRVDAVVMGGLDEVRAGTASLRVLRDPPELLDQLVQARGDRSADRCRALRGRRARRDRPAAEGSASHRRPAVLPPDPDRASKAAVAFVAVLLLYGQLFGYGIWVATGVIEEKNSRVVEVLLSAIRARQLMAGKIAGIGLLGLLS